MQEMIFPRAAILARLRPRHRSPSRPPSPPPIHARPCAAQLPYLTPLASAVLESLDAKQSQPRRRIAQQAGYCLGRVGEALCRFTQMEPPLVVRTGRGYRLTPEGAAIVKGGAA